MSFSVNDIVAVGVESFYATNDHYFPNDALHFLTLMLGLPWCDVVYYSPEEVRVAADGFLSSNGINISPDKRLFLAHFSSHWWCAWACFYISKAVWFPCNAKIIKQKCFFSPRYIYVSDIIDHEIDVFERQEGEQLVYLKVIHCFLIFCTQEKGN